MRTQSQYVISQPLRCWLLSLVLLSGCCLASLAQDMVTDYLHVGKTLKFQGKKFELKWCQHPIEAYYLQEWLPKGETFDNYEQMLTVSPRSRNLKSAKSQTNAAIISSMRETESMSLISW